MYRSKTRWCNFDINECIKLKRWKEGTNSMQFCVLYNLVNLMAQIRITLEILLLPWTGKDQLWNQAKKLFYWNRSYDTDSKLWYCMANFQETLRQPAHFQEQDSCVIQRISKDIFVPSEHVHHKVLSTTMNAIYDETSCLQQLCSWGSRLF